MLHKTRVWQVREVTPEELVDLLVNRTQTCCAGFRCAGYLYLNDSFSEDGAQEYGVIKEATGQQVESITFSWCSKEKASEYIRQISTGEYDDQSWDPGIDLKAQIEDPTTHRCPLCV